MEEPEHAVIEEPNIPAVLSPKVESPVPVKSASLEVPSPSEKSHENEEQEVILEVEPSKVLEIQLSEEDKSSLNNDATLRDSEELPHDDDPECIIELGVSEVTSRSAPSDIIELSADIEVSGNDSFPAPSPRRRVKTRPETSDQDFAESVIIVHSEQTTKEKDAVEPPEMETEETAPVLKTVVVSEPESAKMVEVEVGYQVAEPSIHRDIVIQGSSSSEIQQLVSPDVQQFTSTLAKRLVAAGTSQFETPEGQHFTSSEFVRSSQQKTSRQVVVVKGPSATSDLETPPSEGVPSDVLRTSFVQTSVGSQQVTRQVRFVQKKTLIRRKIVIINGIETVTEEIIDEPPEISEYATTESIQMEPQVQHRVVETVTPMTFPQDSVSLQITSQERLSQGFSSTSFSVVEGHRQTTHRIEQQSVKEEPFSSVTIEEVSPSSVQLPNQDATQLVRGLIEKVGYQVEEPDVMEFTTSSNNLIPDEKKVVKVTDKTSPLRPTIQQEKQGLVMNILQKSIKIKDDIPQIPNRMDAIPDNKPTKPVFSEKKPVGKDNILKHEATEVVVVSKESSPEVDVSTSSQSDNPGRQKKQKPKRRGKGLKEDDVSSPETGKQIMMPDVKEEMGKSLGTQTAHTETHEQPPLIDVSLVVGGSAKTTLDYDSHIEDSVSRTGMDQEGLEVSPQTSKPTPPTIEPVGKSKKQKLTKQAALVEDEKVAKPKKVLKRVEEEEATTEGRAPSSPNVELEIRATMSDCGDADTRLQKGITQRAKGRGNGGSLVPIRSSTDDPQSACIETPRDEDPASISQQFIDSESSFDTAEIIVSASFDTPSSESKPAASARSGKGKKPYKNVMAEQAKKTDAESLALGKEKDLRKSTKVSKKRSKGGNLLVESESKTMEIRKMEKGLAKQEPLTKTLQFSPEKAVEIPLQVQEIVSSTSREVTLDELPLEPKDGFDGSKPKALKQSNVHQKISSPGQCSSDSVEGVLLVTANIEGLGSSSETSKQGLSKTEISEQSGSSLDAKVQIDIDSNIGPTESVQQVESGSNKKEKAIKTNIELIEPNKSVLQESMPEVLDVIADAGSSNILVAKTITEEDKKHFEDSNLMREFTQAKHQDLISKSKKTKRDKDKDLDKPGLEEASVKPDSRDLGKVSLVQEKKQKSKGTNRKLCVHEASSREQPLSVETSRDEHFAHQKSDEEGVVIDVTILAHKEQLSGGGTSKKIKGKLRSAEAEQSLPSKRVELVPIEPECQNISADVVISLSNRQLIGPEKNIKEIKDAEEVLRDMPDINTTQKFIDSELASVVHDLEPQKTSPTKNKAEVLAFGQSGTADEEQTFKSSKRQGENAGGPTEDKMPSEEVSKLTGKEATEKLSLLQEQHKSKKGSIEDDSETISSGEGPEATLNAEIKEISTDTSLELEDNIRDKIPVLGSANLVPTVERLDVEAGLVKNLMQEEATSLDQTASSSATDEFKIELNVVDVSSETLMQSGQAKLVQPDGIKKRKNKKKKPSPGNNQVIENAPVASSPCPDITNVEVELKVSKDATLPTDENAGSITSPLGSVHQLETSIPESRTVDVSQPHRTQLGDVGRIDKEGKNQIALLSKSKEKNDKDHLVEYTQPVTRDLSSSSMIKPLAKSAADPSKGLSKTTSLPSGALVDFATKPIKKGKQEPPRTIKKSKAKMVSKILLDENVLTTQEEESEPSTSNKSVQYQSQITSSDGEIVEITFSAAIEEDSSETSSDAPVRASREKQRRGKRPRPSILDAGQWAGKPDAKSSSEKMLSVAPAYDSRRSRSPSYADVLANRQESASLENASCDSEDSTAMKLEDFAVRERSASPVYTDAMKVDKPLILPDISSTTIHRSSRRSKSPVCVAHESPVIKSQITLGIKEFRGRSKSPSYACVASGSAHGEFWYPDDSNALGPATTALNTQIDSDAAQKTKRITVQDVASPVTITPQPPVRHLQKPTKTGRKGASIEPLPLVVSSGPVQEQKHTTIVSVELGSQPTAKPRKDKHHPVSAGVEEVCAEQSVSKQSDDPMLSQQMNEAEPARFKSAAISSLGSKSKSNQKGPNAPVPISQLETLPIQQSQTKLKKGNIAHKVKVAAPVQSVPQELETFELGDKKKNEGKPKKNIETEPGTPNSSEYKVHFELKSNSPISEHVIQDDPASTQTLAKTAVHKPNNEASVVEPNDVIDQQLFSEPSSIHQPLNKKKIKAKLVNKKDKEGEDSLHSEYSVSIDLMSGKEMDQAILDEVMHEDSGCPSAPTAEELIEEKSSSKFEESVNESGTSVVMEPKKSKGKRKKQKSGAIAPKEDEFKISVDLISSGFEEPPPIDKEKPDSAAPLLHGKYQIGINLNTSSSEELATHSVGSENIEPDQVQHQILTSEDVKSPPKVKELVVGPTVFQESPTPQTVETGEGISKPDKRKQGKATLLEQDKYQSSIESTSGNSQEESILLTGATNVEQGRIPQPILTTGIQKDGKSFPKSEEDVTCLTLADTSIEPKKGKGKHVKAATPEQDEHQISLDVTTGVSDEPAILPAGHIIVDVDRSRKPLLTKGTCQEPEGLITLKSVSGTLNISKPKNGKGRPDKLKKGAAPTKAKEYHISIDLNSGSSEEQPTLSADSCSIQADYEQYTPLTSVTHRKEKSSLKDEGAVILNAQISCTPDVIESGKEQGNKERSAPSELAEYLSSYDMTTSGNKVLPQPTRAPISDSDVVLQPTLTSEKQKKEKSPPKKEEDMTYHILTQTPGTSVVTKTRRSKTTSDKGAPSVQDQPTARHQLPKARMQKNEKSPPEVVECKEHETTQSVTTHSSVEYQISIDSTASSSGGQPLPHAQDVNQQPNPIAYNQEKQKVLTGKTLSQKSVIPDRINARKEKDKPSKYEQDRTSSSEHDEYLIDVNLSTAGTDKQQLPAKVTNIDPDEFKQPTQSAPPEYWKTGKGKRKPGKPQQDVSSEQHEYQISVDLATSSSEEQPLLPDGEPILPAASIVTVGQYTIHQPIISLGTPENEQCPPMGEHVVTRETLTETSVMKPKRGKRKPGKHQQDNVSSVKHEYQISVDLTNTSSEEQPLLSEEEPILPAASTISVGQYKVQQPIILGTPEKEQCPPMGEHVVTPQTLTETSEMKPKVAKGKDKTGKGKTHNAAHLEQEEYQISIDHDTSSHEAQPTVPIAVGCSKDQHTMSTSGTHKKEKYPPKIEKYMAFQTLPQPSGIILKSEEDVTPTQMLGALSTTRPKKSKTKAGKGKKGSAAPSEAEEFMFNDDLTPSSYEKQPTPTAGSHSIGQDLVQQVSIFNDEEVVPFKAHSSGISDVIKPEKDQYEPERAVTSEQTEYQDSFDVTTSNSEELPIQPTTSIVDPDETLQPSLSTRKQKKETSPVSKEEITCQTLAQTSGIPKVIRPKRSKGKFDKAAPSEEGENQLPKASMQRIEKHPLDAEELATSTSITKHPGASATGEQKKKSKTKWRGAQDDNEALVPSEYHISIDLTTSGNEERCSESTPASRYQDECAQRALQERHLEEEDSISGLGIDNLQASPQQSIMPKSKSYEEKKATLEKEYSETKQTPTEYQLSVLSSRRMNQYNPPSTEEKDRYKDEPSFSKLAVDTSQRLEQPAETRRQKKRGGNQERVRIDNPSVSLQNVYEVSFNVLSSDKAGDQADGSKQISVLPSQPKSEVAEQENEQPTNDIDSNTQRSPTPTSGISELEKQEVGKPARENTRDPLRSKCHVSINLVSSSSSKDQPVFKEKSTIEKECLPIMPKLVKSKDGRSIVHIQENLLDDQSLEELPSTSMEGGQNSQQDRGDVHSIGQNQLTTLGSSQSIPVHQHLGLHQPGSGNFEGFLDSKSEQNWPQREARESSESFIDRERGMTVSPRVIHHPGIDKPKQCKLKGEFEFDASLADSDPKEIGKVDLSKHDSKENLNKFPPDVHLGVEKASDPMPPQTVQPIDVVKQKKKPKSKKKGELDLDVNISITAKLCDESGKSHVSLSPSEPHPTTTNVTTRPDGSTLISISSAAVGTVLSQSDDSTLLSQSSTVSDAPEDKLAEKAIVSPADIYGKTSEGQAPPVDHQKLQNTLIANIKDIVSNPDSTSYKHLLSNPDFENLHRTLEMNLQCLKLGADPEIRTICITTIAEYLETITYIIYNVKISITDGGCAANHKLVQLKTLQKELDYLKKCIPLVGKAEDPILIELEKQRLSITNSLEETTALSNNREDEWNHFLNEIQRIYSLLGSLNDDARSMDGEKIKSFDETISKLERCEKANAEYKYDVMKLIEKGRKLSRPPFRISPSSLVQAARLNGSIEDYLIYLRNHLEQAMMLSQEYRETLVELEHVTNIAQRIVDSRVMVNSLSHLQEEMQKGRKFFVSLSHCRSILESLEEHLDSETKQQHAALHKKLHAAASDILDRAGERIGVLALAASRWTIVEQGLAEEAKWLQVAHQRAPCLTGVSTLDYEQYISMYQALSADLDLHSGRVWKLLNSAHSLQSVISCPTLEESCDSSREQLSKLRDKVNQDEMRLLSFREAWLSFRSLASKIDQWITIVRKDKKLKKIPVDISRYWELKAEYDYYKQQLAEINTKFEVAMSTLPVSDEVPRRDAMTELNNRWAVVDKLMLDAETRLCSSLSAHDVDTPRPEQLLLLEKRFEEIESAFSSMHGILTSDDQLQIYLGKLQVLVESVSGIQEDLSRISLGPSVEIQRLAKLQQNAKVLEDTLKFQMKGISTILDKLAIIRKSINRAMRDQLRAVGVLDQCQNCVDKDDPDVRQALVNTKGVCKALAEQWSDLLNLRQDLHSIPLGVKASIDLANYEKEISKLQESHSSLESRANALVAELECRTGLWDDYNDKLDTVKGSVREAEYMMDMLKVQGPLDYCRLVKATSRLKGVQETFEEREPTLEELRASEEALEKVVREEIGARLRYEVQEQEEAWRSTQEDLVQLVKSYTKAAKLWSTYATASQRLDLQPVTSVQEWEEKKGQLSELERLADDISSEIGVEVLKPEISSLARRLEDVQQESSPVEDIADPAALLEDINKNLKTIRVVGSDPTKQLNDLLGHLTTLGRTEANLSTVSRTSPDHQQIIQLLQVWERIFRETFQEYHRLSSRLVQTEQRNVVLNLWQDYLSHINQLLNSNPSQHYDDLREQNQLFKVHRDVLGCQKFLLSTQTASGDVPIIEKLSLLTNLHNETLSKIMEKQAEIQGRIKIWDEYREDQTALLDWLKDMESERNRLKLRYITLSTLKKTMYQIEDLLKRLNEGSTKEKNLQMKLSELVKCCDESLSNSLRIEFTSISHRLSNLKAALSTWKDHITKVYDNSLQYEKQFHKVNLDMSEIQKQLSEESCRLVDSSPFDQLQSNLIKLENVSKMVDDTLDGIKSLKEAEERLKDSLSPNDLKNMSQKCWLMEQQQCDLALQLSLAKQAITDRVQLSELFDKRFERFILWARDVNDRLEGITKLEAGQALKRLETEVHAEVSLHKREVDWLAVTGRELLSVENDTSSRGQTLVKDLELLSHTWQGLLSNTDGHASKLRSIVQRMSQLELQMSDLRVSLQEIESKLLSPIILDDATKQCVDRLLQEHQTLQNEVDQKSSNVSEVLNLFELLLHDCEACQISIDTDGISMAMNNLEKRWKNICIVSAERKTLISVLWSKIQQILNVAKERKKGLQQVDKELGALEKQLEVESKSSIETIGKTSSLCRAMEKDLRKLSGDGLTILEDLYRQLLHDYSLPNDLLAIPEDLMDLEKSLTERIKLCARASFSRSSQYEKFVKYQRRALTSLIQCDAMITMAEVRDSAQPELRAPGALAEYVKKIETNLQAEIETLSEADFLGLEIMKWCQPSDIDKVQGMIDEYQKLWKNINERLQQLKSPGEAPSISRNLADVGVEVNTLKFETDRSTQVDTLGWSGPMLRKDAFISELNRTCDELESRIDNLKELDQLDTHKKISKYVGQCESTYELAKHLSDTLMEQYAANSTEASVERLNLLRGNFNKVRSLAQQKQSRLKATSAHGKLSCPVCSQKNWHQLETDLWRLEQCVQFAEGTLAAQPSSLPKSLERLEIIIQDQRELLQTLDSHRSILLSMNDVATHLAEHFDADERTADFRTRVAELDRRWDVICERAASSQARLQTTLIQNEEFHETINELTEWLERTEVNIRQSEPIDLNESRDLVLAKYEKFKELKVELERCEPRIVSLEEAARQVLNDDTEVSWQRLHRLRLRLHSLIRLTNHYLLVISTAFPSFSIEESTDENDSSSNDDEGTSTLVRCNRFLGRVVRASVPISAFLLLLLGAATLLPQTQRDFDCTGALTFAPVLRFPPGPPPV